MGNLSNRRKSNIKIDATVNEKLTVAFRFNQLTTNKGYNFDYFNDKNNKFEMYNQLFEKLKELSDYTNEELKDIGKIKGCEPIPYNRFNNNFKGVLDNIDIVSKDSKLAVFRFAKNNYRLICKSDILNSHILYIVGFDFNFTAYDHG